MMLIASRSGNDNPTYTCYPERYTEEAHAFSFLWAIPGSNNRGASLSRYLLTQETHKNLSACDTGGPLIPHPLLHRACIPTSCRRRLIANVGRSCSLKAPDPSTLELFKRSYLSLWVVLPSVHFFFPHSHLQSVLPSSFGRRSLCD